MPPSKPAVGSSPTAQVTRQVLAPGRGPITLGLPVTSVAGLATGVMVALARWSRNTRRLAGTSTVRWPRRLTRAAGVALISPLAWAGLVAEPFVSLSRACSKWMEGFQRLAEGRLAPAAAAVRAAAST